MSYSSATNQNALQFLTLPISIRLSISVQLLYSYTYLILISVNISTLHEIKMPFIYFLLKFTAFADRGIGGREGGCEGVYGLSTDF